jgi:hypothetical protein
MAGPWEQYQQAAPVAGPWTQFGPPAINVPEPKRAKDIGDAVIAGLQNSATGLALRGQMPSQQLGEDAPWYQRLFAGAAGVVADIPLSVAAAVPATPGGPIAMGAAGFAAPMALRDALIEAYSNNHAASWGGVWDIAKAAMAGGTKGAVIGAATMGAGRVVGAALPATAGAVTKGAAVFGTELSTLTTTSAALEGRMPTAMDFMDNALLLGGMKGVVKAAGGLRSIYAQTGRTPDMVVADAAREPSIARELKEGAVDPFSYAEKIGIGIEVADRAEYISSHGKLYVPDLPPAEFQTKFGATREQVVSHELGHALLDKWGMTGEIKGPYYADLRAELRSISKEFRGSVWDTARGHAQKSQELLADGLAVWMTNPAARSKMPLFEKLLGTRIDDLKGAPLKAAQVIPEAYEAAALQERIKAAIDADPRPDMLREALNADPMTNVPKLGDTRLMDPVKYEYITDSATAKGVLRGVTELYQNEIQAQTRGVVPNKQTATEALQAIAGGKVSERVIGEAGNAAEIYARAHLLKGATNHAMQELAKIKDLPVGELTPQAKLTALAAIERVGMLKAELEGVGAEAGRALQILRSIKYDSALLGEANVLLAAAERKGSLQDIAKLMSQMKDPAQQAEFASQYAKATTTEKVIEYWKAGILSGPLTHLANVMGNTTKWMIDLPESTLAATITAGQRATKGDPLTMAQYKARALSPIIGLQLGAADALKVAGEALRSDTLSLDKGDIYRPAIEGKKGEIIRTPFRLLQAQDALFRIPAERAKAYELAVDRVVKEGLHPDTMEAKVKITEYLNNPATGLSATAGQKVLDTIAQTGAEAVFSQRVGPRLEMVQQAMAGHWSQLVIPFVRTPANLVSWAVQHTPGLNLLSGRWRADFAAGGEAQARAIARVTIGTGIAMTAFAMAEDGILTGGGLFDKEQGGAKRGAGWQPYSIQIDGKFYSYQRIEPVAKVMGIAADLVEMIKASKKEEDKAKMVPMLVLMFGNATISTTYLSGLAGIVNAMVDPVRYGDQFMEGYATSLVPKIIGQTTTLADPYKREVDGVLDAFQSQLPYFREKLMPKRDVWGQPSANDKWFAVMPVATSEVSKDKVKTEAVRLELAMSPAPKFLTEKGPFKPSDKRIDLTAEQRDVFAQVAGKNAMEILAPIVNAADWERIPDFAKEEIYKRVIEGTRKQGQYAALPADATERDKVRQKIVDTIVKQTEAVAPEKRIKAEK